MRTSLHLYLFFECEMVTRFRVGELIEFNSDPENEDEDEMAHIKKEKSKNIQGISNKLQ